MGLIGNDTVNGLGKAVYGQNLPAMCGPPSLQCNRNTLYSALNVQTVNHRNTESAGSTSIQHYEHLINTPHNYRCQRLMVHKHNVVSARPRLGYRLVWQVSQNENVSQYSTCKLCHLANAKTLYHYCLVCPTVRDLIPQEQDLLLICQYPFQEDNLDLIL